MSEIKCNENCSECGKYTTIHSNGGEYITYDCLITGKTITKDLKNNK